MTANRGAVWLSLASALALTLAPEFQAGAQDEPTAKPSKADTAKAKGKAATNPSEPAASEFATFGAGCFWSTEAVFERVPGVRSVVSGFAGGSVVKPTYDQVCTGQTGHAEAVRVEYDPSKVTYERLLKVFFGSHDPTTLDSQGDDFGPQYRSAIFYHDDDQKQAALKVYKNLTARRVYRSPIVTELTAFTTFYPAEPYHQDYFRNNPDSEYSSFYIVPKLRKLRAKLQLR